MLKQKGWHPIHRTKQRFQLTNQQIKQQAAQDLRKQQAHPQQKSVVSLWVFAFVLLGFLSLFLLAWLAR